MASVDVFLVWASWAVSFAMAGLGVYASWRPNPASGKRVGLIAIFVLLFAAGGIVSTVQQNRAKQGTQVLNSTLSGIQQNTSHLPEFRGFIQLDNISAAPGYSTVAPGRTLSFAVTWLNAGSEPIPSAYAFGGLRIPRGIPSADDELAIKLNLKDNVTKQYQEALGKHYNGSVIGAGQRTVNNFKLDTPLTEQDVSDLLHHRRRIYIYLWATWQDLNGHSGTLEQCEWLDIPSNGQLYPETDWIACH
jgi:hypothetical protein